MNMRFEYLYRDGSNYKQWGEILFSGEPSDGLTQRLTRSLESTEFFIADNRRSDSSSCSLPRYLSDLSRRPLWHEFSAVSATEDGRMTGATGRSENLSRKSSVLPRSAGML
jgi:hypothetical protein